MVIAELHVHEAGDLLIGGCIAVVLHILNEGGCAVAYASDGNPDGGITHILQFSLYRNTAEPHIHRRYVHIPQKSDSDVDMIDKEDQLIDQVPPRSWVGRRELFHKRGEGVCGIRFRGARMGD